MVADIEHRSIMVTQHGYHIGHQKAAALAVGRADRCQILHGDTFEYTLGGACLAHDEWRQLSRPTLDPGVLHGVDCVLVHARRMTPSDHLTGFIDDLGARLRRSPSMVGDPRSSRL